MSQGHNHAMWNYLPNSCPKCSEDGPQAKPLEPAAQFVARPAALANEPAKPYIGETDGNTSNIIRPGGNNIASLRHSQVEAKPSDSMLEKASQWLINKPHDQQVSSRAIEQVMADFATAECAPLHAKIAELAETWKLEVKAATNWRVRAGRAERELAVIKAQGLCECDCPPESHFCPAEYAEQKAEVSKLREKVMEYQEESGIRLKIIERKDAEIAAATKLANFHKGLQMSMREIDNETVQKLREKLRNAERELAEAKADCLSRLTTQAIDHAEQLTEAREKLARMETLNHALDGMGDAEQQAREQAEQSNRELREKLAAYQANIASIKPVFNAFRAKEWDDRTELDAMLKEAEQKGIRFGRVDALENFKGELAEARKAGAEEERERCAKIAESTPRPPLRGPTWSSAIATSIRQAPSEETTSSERS